MMIISLLKKTLLLLVLFFYSSLFAQVSKTGNITSRIDSIINNIPGFYPQGKYLQPSGSSRNILRTIFLNIITKNYEQANNEAEKISYRLVKFTDSESNNKLYYILERLPESTSKFWGTYVFNPEPDRSKLVIESPHPLHDRKTGSEGFYIFKKIGAKAFYVSGTHRCNGISFSKCSGTTTACNSSGESYRYSDQPHTVLGPLQIFTEVLNAYVDDLIVIQPHGFAKTESDPDVIMSNGTKYTPLSIDYLNILKDNLQSLDPTITTKIAHLDADWYKLIGRTNTQGRLLNNTSIPCYNNATETTGRFLHLEQSYSKFRKSIIEWNVMAKAIEMTFPKDTTGKNHFALKFDGVDDYLYYPNNTQLQKMDGAVDYTIEAWLYINKNEDIDNYDRVLFRKNCFSFHIKTDRSFVFAVYKNNEWHYYSSKSNVLNVGKWNHVAIIRNTNSEPSSLRIFVNGYDETTDTSRIGYALPYGGADDYLLFGMRSDSTKFLKGLLDEVRLKNSAVKPWNLNFYQNTKRYSTDFNTSVLLHFEEGTGSITINSAINNTYANLGNEEANDISEPEWIIWDDSISNVVENSISNVVENSNNLNIPNTFSVLQNYPNPFNSQTSFKYYIPTSGKVNIKIYDIIGCEVFSINNTYNSSGIKTQKINANSWTSGLYIYQIQFGSKSASGKMILLK